MKGFQDFTRVITVAMATGDSRFELISLSGPHYNLSHPYPSAYLCLSGKFPVAGCYIRSGNVIAFLCRIVVVLVPE